MSGNLPIRLTGFDMRPPHELPGYVRVDDTLVIGFDAAFLSAEPE